ncbi:MAG: GIY-YIG nuclease family protein [Defluviitaleaceae bacterium]|nr:GIY-YIG nuclease family protein [Defluviitaleaceae bacterium]
MKARDVVAIVGLISSLIPQRDRDFEQALASQNIDTEAPLRYQLRDLEFVDHTRVLKLTFVKIRTYRTVERYVQRNNEKFKIYSDWKEKETKIPAITLKLTNTVLENLRDADYLMENIVVKKRDAADLVSDFAFDILSKLITDPDKGHLMPSWMEKELLTNQMEQEINSIEIDKAVYEAAIATATDKIFKLESERNNLDQRVQKMSGIRAQRVLFIFLSIFTLGIFALINSTKRLERLTTQLCELKQESAKETDNLNQKIKSNLDVIDQLIQDINKTKTDYIKNIDQVQPLSDYVTNSTDFVLLKHLTGMSYSKIKGVYIIRNKELDKVYVGQSKDVLKRLKDHFTGTQPKNIIFAEDYYKSNFEPKDELFEFKIEALETKDELDKREMELISEYDAFNNGYNKTAGNV